MANDLKHELKHDTKCQLSIVLQMCKGQLSGWTVVYPWEVVIYRINPQNQCVMYKTPGMSSWAQMYKPFKIPNSFEQLQRKVVQTSIKNDSGYRRWYPKQEKDRQGTDTIKAAWQYFRKVLHGSVVVVYK